MFDPHQSDDLDEDLVVVVHELGHARSDQRLSRPATGCIRHAANAELDFPSGTFSLHPREHP